MREFLRGLEFDDETIDTIMAEYGKLVTKDKEELQTLKNEIISLKENSGIEWKKKYDDLEKQIKDQEQEEKFNRNLDEVFGDKKFVNDYTKNAIIDELKNAMKDENNSGKTTKDLFDSITKDKEGIFENPNQMKDMPGVGDFDGSITKDVFNKMGYMERLEFKRDNPDLFKKYNE